MSLRRAEFRCRRIWGGYVGQDHSLWNIEPTLFNVPGDSGRVTTTRQFPLTLPEHFVRVQRN